ncbi:MAG: hypothetical protein SWQ30_19470 [Thermodesulfobacteriota bacterium]|nr:hypothetical protein [Thermodesulfobacteriota bacterium]
MSRVFRPSNREAKILSKIESSKKRERRLVIEQLKNVLEPLSNAIAMKLIEERLIETNNKGVIEEQIAGALQKLSHADDFEIEYSTAPIRDLVTRPNVVSLYLTAFVVEQLVNHRSVEDVFGSDEEIYLCINRQVARFVLQ